MISSPRYEEQSGQFSGDQHADGLLRRAAFRAAAADRNASLGEIAQETGVSRQGVHEALKKAEKSLQGFEEKLGLVARFRSQEQVLQNALASVDELLGRCEDPGVRQGLLRIKNDINSIEEQV